MIVSERKQLLQETKVHQAGIYFNHREAFFWRQISASGSSDAINSKTV
jgi:hypothetical protein